MLLFVVSLGSSRSLLRVNVLVLFVALSASSRLVFLGFLVMLTPMPKELCCNECGD